MKGKTKIIYVLIMNFPIALSISLAAQLLATGQIVVSLLFINLLIAYGVAFVIGMTIPVNIIGEKFAKRFKVKNELGFGLLVNLPINFIYVTIISIIMTYFNVIILAKLPLGAFVGAFLATYPMLFLVGYIVAFLVYRPALKMAMSLSGETSNI